MMEHLTSSAAEWLNEPEDARIEAILLDKWVSYSQAQRVLDRLAALHHHPTILRMPNLLLVGDTNNGKTHILDHYAKPYQPQLKRRRGKAALRPEQWPVFYVQAPPVPDERRFYHAILNTMEAIYPPNGHIETKQYLVNNLLRDLGVKLLIIDEIQHVLAGTQTKQREFLNVLKFLTNEVKIPLICAGIRTAHNVIQHDEQLANRFEPILLPRWSMNEEYLRLLASFERLLPLRKPSYLIEQELAIKLLALSEGTIGELVRLLKLAAVYAVRNGSECITVKLLGQLDYTPPSQRLNRHPVAL